MSYILMIHGFDQKTCFVVKTETSRFGWKRWHDDGWKFYKRYSTWRESQEDLRDIKDGILIVQKKDLSALRGNWNEEQPTVVKIMRSKYKGWCWHCQQTIQPNSMIEWNTETRKARHKKCPNKKSKGPSKRPTKGGARFVTGRA